MSLSDMLYVPRGVCILGEDEPVSLVRRLGWTALAEDQWAGLSDDEIAVWFQRQHEVARRSV